MTRSGNLFSQSPPLLKNKCKNLHLSSLKHLSNKPGYLSITSFPSFPSSISVGSQQGHFYKMKISPKPNSSIPPRMLQLPGKPWLWSLPVALGAGTAIPKLEAANPALGCAGSCLQSTPALESMHMKRIWSNYGERRN